MRESRCGCRRDRLLKLRPHGGGKRPPKVTELALPPGGMQLELHIGRGENNLLVESDLVPGERATGYVSYEWNGGYQLPRPVVFEGVELPNITAPKRIVTSLDVYGATYLNWQDCKPGLDGQEAMVRDLKRLGFNRLQIWGGDARPYRNLGINAGTSFGGSFSVEIEKYPESAGHVPVLSGPWPDGEPMVSASERDCDHQFLRKPCDLTPLLVPA